MLARKYNYEEQWAVPQRQEPYSRPRVVRTERQRKLAKTGSGCCAAVWLFSRRFSWACTD